VRSHIANAQAGINRKSVADWGDAVARNDSPIQLRRLCIATMLDRWGAIGFHGRQGISGRTPNALIDRKAAIRKVCPTTTNESDK
jgi:hypothetical protein